MAMKNVPIGINSTFMTIGRIVRLHAEIDAVYRTSKILDRYKTRVFDLVVIRVSKNGQLADSAPCYRCTRKLKNLKHLTIRKIHYSNCHGTITSMFLRDYVTTHVCKYNNNNYH